MNAEIVSIGTELLMGELVDTNSSYMASELAKLGIELRWVTKVGDNLEQLHEVFDKALQRSDVTLTTGGLGPTSDDMTREAIASVFGEEMTVRDDLLEHLKSLFANRGAPMPETNIKQATLIPSAQVIVNPMGTAPGWWAERDSHVIVAMPGPPRENQNMWANEVAPRLKERNPDIAIVTRNLKTFGISEGAIDGMLSDLFQSENPYLGIYSKQDGIHLRAIATASTEEEAYRLIQPIEAEIRQTLGNDAIWGEDEETPETQAVALLREKGMTLGVIESFTGGLLASNLADLENNGEFLKGSAVIYDDKLLENHGVDPDLIKQYGAASQEASESMAKAARVMFDADIGIGITGLVNNTPVGRRPTGTTYIGYSMDGQTASVSGQYPGNRQRMRSRAVSHSLLGLIRFLKGQNLQSGIMRR